MTYKYVRYFMNGDFIAYQLKLGPLAAINKEVMFLIYFQKLRRGVPVVQGAC